MVGNFTPSIGIGHVKCLLPPGALGRSRNAENGTPSSSSIVSMAQAVIPRGLLYAAILLTPPSPAPLSEQRADYAAPTRAGQTGLWQDRDPNPDPWCANARGRFVTLACSLKYPISSCEIERRLQHAEEAALHSVLFAVLHHLRMMLFCGGLMSIFKQSLFLHWYDFMIFKDMFFRNYATKQNLHPVLCLHYSQW